MADHLSKERRSWLMSRVPSKNTGPELIVRRAAHALGLRFRLHRGDLPGRPDIVFPKRRIALFVHGCFWHRHEGCRLASNPKSRADFWQKKFDGNVARDRAAIISLQNQGWKVAIIWECETRAGADLRSRLQEIFFDCHCLKASSASCCDR